MMMAHLWSPMSIKHPQHENDRGWDSAGGEKRRGPDMTGFDGAVTARPARGVRLIEQNGHVVAYPEPHLTPVLPGAWNPLTREEQDAVLKACDAAPQALVLRLGSLWEPGAEYRVYQLLGEWSGLFVASSFGRQEDQGDSAASSARNHRLLALGRDALHAVSIAVNFLNWDLETNGHPWRLSADKDGRVQL